MGNTNVAMLNQPEVKALTSDNVCAYAQRQGHPPLTRQRKGQIEDFLKNNKSSRQLAKLLNEYIDMYQHYNGLAGLTPAETEKLRTLVAIRTDFKNSHIKGEYDGPGFRKFIANERKIVSFNKSMQWWQTNIEMLRKLELWENINTIIINTARDQQLPPSNLTKRQHNLTDIKNTWSQQQLFASFSSENLLEFYRNYMVVMESTLTDVLANTSKYPEEIINFLFNTLYNLKEMRKQAVYSMVARLNTMETNNDVESDDVLHNIINQIENKCVIKLERTGLKPAPRKGLTPTTLNDLVAEINDYIKKNPEEKILPVIIGSHNAFITRPDWAGINLSPTIIFIANKLPELLLEADMKKNIYLDILADETTLTENFIYYRIKKMLELYTDEINRLTLNGGKNPYKIIIDDLNKKQNKFNNQLQNTYLRLSIEVRNTIQRIVANIFSNNELNYDWIIELSTRLSHAEEFDRTFLKSTYDPDKDIILAVSTKIKQLVEKGETLSNAMIEKAAKLLMMATDSTTPMHEIKDQLKQLPDLLRRIHANDDAYIMHYITHHIEANLLINGNVETALKRHEYIASLYDEPWAIKSTNQQNQCAIQPYISTVLIPLVHQSPTINLHNFEEDHTLQNIKSLCNNSTEIYKLPYETEIEKKINNLFSIKKFIYQSGTKNIDLIKLKNLTNRVSAFFTQPELKNKVMITIENSCDDLIKNYMVSLIQANKSPDFTYLQAISNTLNKDIFIHLAEDKDIAKILINYVELYGGTENILGQLLVELSKNNARIQNEDLLYAYASKRLAYIAASNIVTQQDYHFFEYFIKFNSISNLFQHHRKQFSLDIADWLQPKSAWHSQRAMIIELFGSSKEIDSYRFKRLRELISINIENNHSDEKSNNICTEFLNTLNQFKAKDGKIVNPQNLVSPNTTLHAYLDYAASSKPWSPITEMIIEKSGATKQLQTLHYHSLSKQLGTCINIQNTYIGTKFQSIKDKASYLEFIGNENARKLTAQIEKNLIALQAANVFSSKNELSENDYHLYLSMIQALGPFKQFYNELSEHISYKNMFNDLHNLEAKIQLHRAMHNTIKKQSDLLTLATGNTELHNRLLTLTRNVIDLEDSRYVTSENTSHYIHFAMTEIIDQITTLLENSKLTLSIPILMTLANLLGQLPSNHLKLQLSIAHKQEALSNPIWLTLINHIDEHRGMLAVINHLSHTSNSTTLGKDFSQLLEFSTKLNSTKKLIHQRIKMQLLTDAGISAKHQKEIHFDKLIQPGTLSDKELLALWQSTISKIEPANHELPQTTPGMIYMIKLATRSGEELLLRARTNPDLLSKFTNTFASLSVFYTPQESTEKQHLSIWASPNQPDKTIQPLINIAKRTVVTMLIQRLEKFIEKHTTHNELMTYQKISNDPIYLAPDKTPDKLSPIIKDMMHLKSDKMALAITHTILLYHDAQKTLLTNTPAHKLNSLIYALAQTTGQNPALASIPDFKLLIDNLVKLSNYNPMIKNDHEFDETPAWKRLFSLSG